ncbi:MAG: ABC transporter ATP-binding protein [Microscillaceae bacterium]|jgi:osmoprotectant transport system ATP-binding protein|nr:ABC transporter ATP-binding protein [Microscillaceae bacterium]
MIEIRKLSKRFGADWVVKDVSFSVAEGETLVLLGTSGSGKTTTLKMLNRLVEPSAGEIWIKGQNILTQNPVQLRRTIGYVIQNFGLFPHFTVAQNIAIVPKLLGWRRSNITRRTCELLEMLNLPPQDFLTKYPHELSGGQKQRIGIARALAANPPIILLDEPFGALDPITRHQIQQEFKNLPYLKTKTKILVTHDIMEALALGNRIALMDKGELLQIGEPATFVFAPKNEVVRSFFQNQHFQFALKTLTLQEVVSISMQNADYQPNSPAFSPETDLLTVLETTSQNRLNAILIQNAAGEIIGQTTHNAILNGFYQKLQHLKG